MTKIAIIGAGLSGLTAAQKLTQSADVTVFEKSRGFGGRMATRRADPYAFDHGAQYFTAKSKPFESFLSSLLESGVVEPWGARIASLENGKQEIIAREHSIYVAVPGMSALGRALAADHDVKLATRITHLSGTPGCWTLRDEDGGNYGPFDWVVSAVPSPQALTLLPEDFAGYKNLENVEMVPGFALMLGYENSLGLGFDAAFPKSSPIGFISVNSSKPGRDGSSSIVVQSTNEWAMAHVDDDREQVAEMMLEAFNALVGESIQPDHQAIHRWLYANVATPAGKPFLLDRKNRLAACGDWCIEGRVEAAFKSGDALSDALQREFAV